MTKFMSFKDCADLHAKARDAAIAAATAFDATLPPEQQRGFDCGFAWVTIKPARGPFVKYLKENGIGDKAYNGGFQIWYSKFSTSTQSVGTHEVAASAYAKVLCDNGINATTGSRLD